MDGLRRVPDNIPNGEMVAEHLGKPLTAIPDPFGTHESFGAHNNARLRAFLDEFGFDYEFQSSTECYRAGMFDEALLKVLARYDQVMDVMLPSLGAERQATYSPFLPVCARTGRVLQAPVEARDVDAGTITYRDEDGSLVETPVTGGRCKLQWKPDWAMRWAALDVDYEMSGKDLIDSVRLGARICKILDGTPPAGFTYELFLDENGEKISKSKGNGLTVEEITSEDRMHPDEAARQIANFVKNTTVIGQNPGFDMEFIKQLVLRAGLTQKDRDGNTVPRRLPYHKIDTATLAYEHLRLAGLEKLSLSKEGGICDFMGIEIKGAHTAMGDVAMTIAVYDGLARASWVKRLIWWAKNRKGAGNE